MKQLTFAFLLFIMIPFSQATIGKGLVSDITIRSQDGILAIKVTEPGAQPACVSWVHTYVFDLADNPVLGSTIYSMAMAAQKDAKTVSIRGSNHCLAGTNGEEILEFNIGPWRN